MKFATSTTSLLFITLLSSQGYAADRSLIEEVIVTAQKRSENLYAVPVAIDVIDGEYIAKSSALGLSELEMAIPSLNFGRGGRRTRGEIAIRGVGGFARNIGSNARVVVYVDEVPLGRSTAFDAGLLDVKQIEILKGPQGTLYGMNTIAGAINVTTETPNDTLSNSLQADLGDRNYQLYSFKSNIPLSDSLYGRLQISHREYDGHIKNLASNKDLQGSDLDSARLRFLYQPSNQLNIHTIFDWLNDEADATNAEALSDTTYLSIPLVGYSAAPSPRQVSHDADEFEKREVWGASVKVEYASDSSSDWVSITAYRSSEFSELNEEDYSSLPLSTSIFDEEFTQWTQELRYSSKINEQFDYVAGIFFHSNDIVTGRSAALVLSPTTTLSVATPGKLSSSSYSIFGNMNYRLSPNYELTIGARYQYEEKDIDYNILDTTGLFTNASLKADATYPIFLPKASFNYTAGENSIIYTSIARGSKSGGWNADFVNSLDDIEFDPEYSTNYEIGYKSTLLDGNASILASLFHTNFTDLQVSQFNPATGANEVKNAGEATTEGLELELHYYLTENIDVNFNSSVLKTEYTRFENGGGDGIDYDGNELAYAPEFTSYLGLNIRHPVATNSEAYFHLNYSYSDGSFSHPQNSITTDRVDAFFLVNGYIGVNVNEQYDISLWAKNLTNEESLRFKGISFLGLQRGYYEAPRTVGVSFKATFE